eukprot:scaffold54273_cov59-Phaeocystis_antarctica.AAC.1
MQVHAKPDVLVAVHDVRGSVRLHDAAPGGGSSATGAGPQRRIVRVRRGVAWYHTRGRAAAARGGHVDDVDEGTCRARGLIDLAETEREELLPPCLHVDELGGAVDGGLLELACEHRVRVAGDARAVHEGLLLQDATRALDRVRRHRRAQVHVHLVDDHEKRREDYAQKEAS